MCHTGGTSWILASVFLLFALLEQIDYSLSHPFLEIPGDASALIGGPVNLPWLTSFNESNIAWCYWDYADCSSDPDTVLKITDCPPDEFIGYMYETKARQNISSRHEGWSFLNKLSPCTGGLHRTMLEHKHSGWYRMNIYTSANVADEDLPLTKQTSKYSPFHVYNEMELQVSLQVGDMPESQLLLRDARNGIIELQAQTLKNKHLNIKVWNIFPTDTEVTIKRHIFGLDEVTLYIEQCTGHHQKSCNVDIIEESTDVIYIIELDTRIQGYPIVSIKQRCTFTEVKVDHEDDVDPPSNSSSSESYPWWVLPVLSVIIVLLAVGVIVLAAIFIKNKHHIQVCSKQKTRSKKQKYQAANHAANGKLASADAKREDMKCLNGSIPDK